MHQRNFKTLAARLVPDGAGIKTMSDKPIAHERNLLPVILARASLDCPL